MTLQQRQKWNTPRRNMKPGDIVILKDDSQPRFQWPLGRIVSTEEDHKGFVRAVTVKTSSSVLRRPIDCLVLILPFEEQH